MPGRTGVGAAAGAAGAAVPGPSSLSGGPSSKTLWIAFLSELEAQASSVGSRASYAYRKAATAIKNSREEFTHPCELIKLTGVGAGIIDKLVSRLEQWCVLHHEDMPSKPSHAEVPAKRGRKAAASASRGEPAAAQQNTTAKRQRSRPIEDEDLLSDGPLRGSDEDLLGFAPGDNDSTDDEQLRAAIAASLKEALPAKAPKRGPTSTATAKATTSRPRKQKAPSVPKTYVPNPRTGGYGILLGLFSQTPDVEDEVYLTKSQVISFAQPWCDADYLMPSRGSGSRGGGGSAARMPASVTGASASASQNIDLSKASIAAPISYTAWSSMKTLVTKGLVYQTGNPPKYCLSQDGWELASEMMRVTEGRTASQAGSSASPERPPHSSPLSANTFGRTASAPDQPTRARTPPEASRARPGLQIPVTRPGLFSSSDHPSSSPHDARNGTRPIEEVPAKAKGKGKARDRSQEVVVLSDDSHPMSEDEQLPVLHSSQASSSSYLPGARARPFDRVPSFNSTLTLPPRTSASFPQATSRAIPDGRATRTAASRPDMIDDFPLPGSQQSLAIAISDSDEDIDRPPPNTKASVGPSAPKRHHSNAKPVTMQADNSIVILDADDTVQEGNRTLTGDPSARTRSIPHRDGQQQQGPSKRAQSTSDRQGRQIVGERSRSEGHSEAMRAGISALSRPGQSMQSTMRREVRDGLATSPRSALRDQVNIAGNSGRSTARQHARLSQALPRREVAANGLGWQAQIQAEVGTSQSQGLDEDDFSETPVAQSSRPQPPRKRALSPSYDSDFDIEAIMRGVEDEMLVRAGRTQQAPPKPKPTQAAASSSSRSCAAEPRRDEESSHAARAHESGPRSGHSIHAGTATSQIAQKSSRTGRGRDSLPAVPQPLLPGMAAVSVAADASFDMFDDKSRSPNSSPLNTRMLPPREPISASAHRASKAKDASNVAGQSSLDRSTAWAPPKFKPHIWPAGSFDIILLLDTREIKHGNTSSTNKAGSGNLNRMGVDDTLRGPRSHLSDPLAAKGVPVEVRALELGDVLWIARRKGSAGTETDEVVLDYIVERKRLDDLVQSIPDGRWKEQKFRLSLSGLSKVFYLIEDYDVEQQMRQWGPQIATAISSTQVIDGFFVQRTAGVEASLEWLRKMHQVISQMYQDKALYVLPDEILSRPTYMRLQTHLRRTQPLNAHHITFASYRSMNSKSGSVTVGEVWARMLLCIRGMSEEKVGEAIRVWRTGKEWWEACKAILHEGSDHGRGGARQNAADEDVFAQDLAADSDHSSLAFLDEDPEFDSSQDEFSEDAESAKRRRLDVQKSRTLTKKPGKTASKNAGQKALPAAPPKRSQVTGPPAPRYVVERGRALMAEHVGGMNMAALQAGASADATAAAASLAQYDSRKKIGAALSAKVWDVWWKEKYSKE